LVYTVLIAGNLGAWTWALTLCRDHPVVIGAAVLSYGLGIRHAMDADHIAAIENVTRKLMHEGQRPVGTGLFFLLGHSTVVLIATLGVALSINLFLLQFTALRDVASVFGPLASSLFLLVIAGMNILVFLSVFRAFAGSSMPVPVRVHAPTGSDKEAPFDENPAPPSK
jgi:nickel/cobalt transporter (NiCoT) family protein